MPGFIGWHSVAAGRVARVATVLTGRDRLDGCKVRWGINRMHYLVPPGLYAIGTPTPEAPVLVTANYKMSYDIVRSSLPGRNVWLLVLETFGINVWCAAGKGTFGTDELVQRISSTNLARFVSHRTLILPILGAPGVAAHEVTGQTGFKVRYATIRAADLPLYLDNGMVTTPAMRELTFTFYERLVLVPVELVAALQTTLTIAVCLYLVGALCGAIDAGFKASVAYIGAMLTGVVLGPALLPWLPGRSFSIKGVVIGIAWAICWYLLAGGKELAMPAIAAALVTLPAVSSFYLLNFTGCTPYTSRSGVKREMRLALPAMACAVMAGVILLAVGIIP